MLVLPAIGGATGKFPGFRAAVGCFQQGEADLFSVRMAAFKGLPFEFSSCQRVG